MQNKNVMILKGIRDKIGKDLFREVVEEFRSQAIRIPSDPEYFDKLERNDQIRKDFYEEDMKVPDLANKYNLSRSQIYAITEEI